MVTAAYGLRGKTTNGMYMEVSYRYEFVSGTSATSLYTIGVRYDAGYLHATAQECWCIYMTPQTLNLSAGNPSSYTGLWAAESGEVFVSDASGVVLRHPNPRACEDPWSRDDLGPSLQGIWGLSADFVLTWGGPDEALFRWDGRTWRPMAHPGGWIRAIHGVTPELLYAVGHAGLIARWDGVGWTMVTGPPIRLTCVAVSTDDKFFAAGPGGELLARSAQGMSKLLQHEAAILSLAWWRDELWVGTESGLCKLVGDRLEMVKGNILTANTLDARGDLLIGEPSRIVTSMDGAAFTAFSVKSFARHCAGKGALWAPATPIDYDEGDDV